MPRQPGRGEREGQGQDHRRPLGLRPKCAHGHRQVCGLDSWAEPGDAEDDDGLHQKAGDRRPPARGALHEPAPAGAESGHGRVQRAYPAAGQARPGLPDGPVEVPGRGRRRRDIDHDRRGHLRGRRPGPGLRHPRHGLPVQGPEGPARRQPAGGPPGRRERGGRQARRWRRGERGGQLWHADAPGAGEGRGRGQGVDVTGTLAPGPPRPLCSHGRCPCCRQYC
mmetsp:Transcript_14499/g.41367  ORF Transcript_14499/g.41367 Transcript_14499/m.41367 type:complete len:223 (-) Transcript_14499:79-747(-)